MTKIQDEGQEEAEKTFSRQKCGGAWKGGEKGNFRGEKVGDDVSHCTALVEDKENTFSLFVSCFMLSITFCLFVREMIELLMAKCELTETEVLEAEKNFIAANPSGVISKEEFVLSMKVTLDTSKLG